MNGSEPTGRRWFLRLQSAFVLPLARGIYLLVALGCLLVVIGGTLYVLFLKASVATEPTLAGLPQPYQGAGEVVVPSERTVDLALVGKRFAPPTNVRFLVTAGTLTEPPRERQVLGHFTAETPNGLAPFPEGVSLIGGRDAELFERVADGAGKKVGLAARSALGAQVAEALRDIQTGTSRTFEIRVVARDQYGNSSAPTDLSFTLSFGPKAAAPPASVSEPQPEIPSQPTPLQAIARDVAQIVEPKVNPAYFRAYKTAVAVPGRCGASDDDDSFLANYRRALKEMRSSLTAANVEAFYVGLCEAWKAVLQREAAERERVEQQQRAARRVAEDVRARVQAQNAEIRARHQMAVAQAEATTRLTLTVIGGALALFLSVALVLAFLAIEGHSRAVREAMESMVRLSQEGKKANDPVPNNA